MFVVPLLELHYVMGATTLFLIKQQQQKAETDEMHHFVEDFILCLIKLQLTFFGLHHCGGLIWILFLFPAATICK